MKNETMKPVTTTCPCGTKIPVPVIENDSPLSSDHKFEYDVCRINCPACNRQSTGGNYKTGEVLGWMTAREIARAESEYEAMSLDADMNEWYGRGNW